ncbi:hypothetical protein AJ88_22250 [Mesorhizobium amorphae CCBAU 01583]|nr:hypothetical protein AJ88_22250 [Mesorhizobium amorphae CCBAU 01583]
MQALLKNAEALAKREFGGEKFSRHDILKILGNSGAAQAVQALLKNAEALASWSSAARSSARTISSRSWATTARRRRCRPC